MNGSVVFSTRVWLIPSVEGISLSLVPLAMVWHFLVVMVLSIYSVVMMGRV